jgi:hypothetical protein
MTALILHFAFGLSEIAIVVLGILVVFAVLESVFAFCAGCVTFRILMRMGLIPDDVCKSCVF